MRRVHSLICTLFVASIVFSQNKLGIGIGASPDFNFYKYSNFKFRDTERTDRISLGFSAGVLFNYKLSDNIDFYSNVFYAVKKYSPDRTFNFGVLRRVNMNTLEIPIHVKFKRIDWRYLYFTGGLTYQIEVYKLATYDFFNGFDKSYDFIRKQNYILPNIGIGGEKEINENTFVRIQLNSRFLKCHCEYLNPWIDKIGIEMFLLKTL